MIQMSSPDNISHSGIVNAVSDRLVSVQIVSQSACASCHAKGICSAGDMKEKIIDVITSDAHNYKSGDSVIVYMEESLGFSALILGYLVPFIVLFSVLLTVSVLTGDELLSGLISLAVLLPYYLTLYFNRGRLRKKFDFKLRKASEA